MIARIKCVLGFHDKESKVINSIDEIGVEHTIIYIVCKRCKKFSPVSYEYRKSIN